MRVSLDEGASKQRAVVQSVVALAKALTLDLVVEGVETVAERDALIDMGARFGQGFLYDRAMTFAAAQQLLEAGGVCAVAYDHRPPGNRSSDDSLP